MTSADTGALWAVLIVIAAAVLLGWWIDRRDRRDRRDRDED